MRGIYWRTGCLRAPRPDGRLAPALRPELTRPLDRSAGPRTRKIMLLRKGGAVAPSVTIRPELRIRFRRAATARRPRAGPRGRPAPTLASTGVTKEPIPFLSPYRPVRNRPHAPREPRFRRRADRPDRRIHHRQRRQAAAAGARAARVARLRLRGNRPLSARRRHRNDPHRDAAARRRRRRVGPAPRPRDRERRVRQRGVGAGRRLSLFARVPDDGRPGLGARAGDPRRRRPTSSPRAKCCSS